LCYDFGIMRTSTGVLIPCSFRSAVKSSKLPVEWPKVKIITDLPLALATVRILHWLISRRHRADTYCKSVPSVYRDDYHSEVNEFFLAEKLPRLLVHFIASVSFTDERQCFRPCERRKLAFGVKRQLMPSVQAIQTLLSLTKRTSILRAHIETIDTSVDL